MRRLFGSLYHRNKNSDGSVKCVRLMFELYYVKKLRLHNRHLIYSKSYDTATFECFVFAAPLAVSEVCRRKSIIVLSDEIYARLTFNRQHATIVKHYPEGTILTSGISKWASAGGWRLGYAHFPSHLSKLMAAVRSGASHTYSCAPAPMQFGVAKVGWLNSLRQHSWVLSSQPLDCIHYVTGMAVLIIH
ncbi:hypothetical protein SK128_010766 [Halocaridina rubra]|uniref:Aminotransferase class I/classII large domain-containing protein n=1 Tax=Halocaridina rubra TaxID=373956 RepID=A0AAN9A2K2_HALRR